MFLAFISTIQKWFHFGGLIGSSGEEVPVFTLTWQLLVVFTMSIIVQQLFLLHLNQLGLLLSSSRWSPRIAETVVPIVSSLTNTAGTATVAVIFYVLSLMHDPNAAIAESPLTTAKPAVFDLHLDKLFPPS